MHQQSKPAPGVCHIKNQRSGKPIGTHPAMPAIRGLEQRRHRGVITRIRHVKTVQNEQAGRVPFLQDGPDRQYIAGGQHIACRHDKGGGDLLFPVEEDGSQEHVVDQDIGTMVGSQLGIVPSEQMCRHGEIAAGIAVERHIKHTFTIGHVPGDKGRPVVKVVAQESPLSHDREVRFMSHHAGEHKIGRHRNRIGVSPLDMQSVARFDPEDIGFIKWASTSS